MENCAACMEVAGPDAVPRWKAPLLVVGAILFCPCHLPVTIGVITALGAGLGWAGWFFSNPTIVAVGFSALYLGILIWLVRSLAAQRDRERRLEALHHAHAQP